jgi:hypothetical protein
MIIAAAPPSMLAQNKESRTAPYLALFLAGVG